MSTNPGRRHRPVISLMVACGSVVCLLVALSMWIIASGRTGLRRPSELKTQCLANVKFLAQSISLYVEDYSAWPPATEWPRVATREQQVQIPRPDPLRCPAAPQLAIGYAYNKRLQLLKLTQTDRPDQIVALFEGQGTSLAGGPSLLPGDPRHFGGDNYGFADGHARWLKRQQTPGGGYAQAPEAIAGAAVFVPGARHAPRDPVFGTPPREPPPGRPFVDTPVTYTGSIPTAASLRDRLKGTNVIICVLDAARADHFSSYGYPRPTTPNCDWAAKEGLAFEQHFCPRPLTRPSTASLFTGLYPDTHGLLLNGASPESLGPGTPTLARAFAQVGYATYLLSSYDVVSPEFGLGEDFQYRRAPNVIATGGSLNRVAWLQEALQRVLPQWQAPGARVFAYFHVLPPHLPYRAPEHLASLFQGRPPARCWQSPPADDQESRDGSGLTPASWPEWVDAYDANLRWADSFVGTLEQALAKAGLLERTLLIVTADHGEALMEHGYSLHPDSPYDETIHIPLLIRFPGAHKPIGQVHALTQTIDLFPTLVDLYQLPAPRTHLQGLSLVPLLTGQVKAARQYVVSRAGTNNPCYVVRDAHATLIVRSGRTPRLLYDMDKDPWQTRNIYAEQSSRSATLERAFAAYLRDQRCPPAGFPESPIAGKGAPAAPSGRLTEQQRRELRSMGYLD